VSKDTDRIGSLIQTAQSIQNNLEGDRPIVSEARKMILAALQVEATAMVARRLDQIGAVLDSDLLNAGRGS